MDCTGLDGWEDKRWTLGGEAKGGNVLTYRIVLYYCVSFFVRMGCLWFFSSCHHGKLHED